MKYTAVFFIVLLPALGSSFFLYHESTGAQEEGCHQEDHHQEDYYQKDRQKARSQEVCHQKEDCQEVNTTTCFKFFLKDRSVRVPHQTGFSKIRPSIKERNESQMFHLSLGFTAFHIPSITDSCLITLMEDTSS